MAKKTAELRREKERGARETRAPLDFLADGREMGKLVRLIIAKERSRRSIR